MPLARKRFWALCITRQPPFPKCAIELLKWENGSAGSSPVDLHQQCWVWLAGQWRDAALLNQAQGHPKILLSGHHGSVLGPPLSASPSRDVWESATTLSEWFLCGLNLCPQNPLCLPARLRGISLRMTLRGVEDFLVVDDQGQKFPGSF